MSKPIIREGLRPRTFARLRVAGVAGLAALGVVVCAEQAVAQVNNTTRPPTRYVMPGAVLRVTPSFFDVGTNTRFTFSLVQTGRRMRRATLELRLPAVWRGRTPAGAPLATVPLTGTGSSSRVRVRRTANVLRFSLTNGRRNDTGRYTVTDRALPPATYRVPFVLRVDGYEAASGNLSVLVLPVPVEMPVPAP